MCNNGTRVHLKFSRSMQGGYYLKAVVVAVSSFQKLLFIDADNVPITDPSALFQSAEFKKTGVLMWRDYWDASYAPDVPAVLGVKRSAMPPHTYDSGQMLFDKSRCRSTCICTLPIYIWGVVCSWSGNNKHPLQLIPVFPVRLCELICTMFAHVSVLA